MVTIRFTTTSYRPPHVVTIRTSVDGWENRDIPGVFEGDQWRFTLTDQSKYGMPFQFKLVLDRTYWMAANDLTVDGSKQSDFSIDEQDAQVSFEMRLVRRNAVVVEGGWVEQRLLQPTINEARVWDVIVIGSGMGGGIVAEALADLPPGQPADDQLNVLVLEAGSYIFPVHVANLPRQHRVGEFTKHVWHLWDELEVRDYTNADKSEYRGSLGINFGGRSIVWGGVIPRMTEWELERWPQAIREDLLRDAESPLNRYRQAERLMTMAPEHEAPAPERSEYHVRIRQRLMQVLPEWSFEDTPSAVQSTTAGGSGIPAGMFSTADLLMESRLTEVENSDGRGQHLHINLHHRVVRLDLGDRAGAEVARVIAHDLLNDEEREFRARRVILAAGSIGSPVIALRSGLRSTSKLLGRGLTDHPIFYTHFAIPSDPQNDFFKNGGTCKLLARHRDGRNHPYNILIEIGADLLHGRYVDPDILAAQQAKNHKQMLCEVVFLFDAPLVEGNGVSLAPSPDLDEAALRSLDPPPDSWPIIEMRRCTNADAYIPEMARIRDAIVDAVGGTVLDEKPLPDMDVVVDGPGMPNTSDTTSVGKLGLRRAKLGAAGHELGTLRLGDSDEAVVDANLKVRGYDNLYVCDLSVFPTAPAANPSLTLAALAMRLSDHLKRELATPRTHVPIARPPEAFSRDLDWMPSLVLIGKTTYVWLHQLSKRYRRDISRLDEIPDEELDRLAQSGINGLWLVGLWERSPASMRIKQLSGNPDAVASAYSLFDYEIARDLGGTEAYENLKARAWQRGIRMASDMVPNHVGIDSTWMTDNPGWFVSLDQNPYPWYTYTGPDLSQDDRVGIYIEDHYYDRTDAAVVFKRVERATGREQYVYHGNDGTDVPWNDTAQLNYLIPAVRKAVIETILLVAQKFPVIRFDAAMTLTKQHFQRLWFPEPGNGGDIATRAGRGLTWEQFNAAMPQEFWREVVDEVAHHAPDTLLMAEAFWLLEGYFVRSLGMHRVYNSAFMIMLRNEENAGYRQLMKNTLEFDPEILRRYVNFMTNPDERTAMAQFDQGDKYFGVCTLMVTMPGLPMFGHGQIEGLTEKYGMEFHRPLWDEIPNRALIRRHEQEIFPLLRQRDLFAGVDDFLLFDFVTADGDVNDDVYAYSNWRSANERALVLYHNRFADTRGHVRASVPYAGKTGGAEADRSQMQRTLADGLGLRSADGEFVIFRDTVHHREFLRSVRQLFDVGLEIELRAYTCHVFTKIDQVADPQGRYARLADALDGSWVTSVEAALEAQDAG
ncbi:MAG: GMC oxidoreductase [Chloroflexota bacterium]